METLPRKDPPVSPGRALVVAATLTLFLVWSNSFVAIGYLLGGDTAAPRFDWIGLTVARFLPAAVACAVYCFGFHARASIAVLKSDGPRLLACGVLAVPAYNFALGYGQQHGVPAPIASLTTALLPLFVMLLAAAFLGERLTGRRMLGFAIALAGMVLVALARRGTGAQAYSLAIGVTVLAPASWSIFSVLCKRPSARIPPLLWTYLAVLIGSVLLLPFLPHAWGQWRRLDGAGWGALLYLSFPCTVFGFAVWTWLLRYLPASSVGFTVFLNPPLTTLSKLLLATILPASFVFAVKGQEFAGGALALLGLLVAVTAGKLKPKEQASESPGCTPVQPH